MAYSVTMGTSPAFPHEWERTPPKAQAYIQALEARVETMASMVHTLQEQVVTGPAAPNLSAFLTPTFERSSTAQTGTSPRVSEVGADNRITLAMLARCRWKKS